MIVIALLVLVLFGSKKLPGFARSLGKSMGEFKRAREEFEQELHRAAEEPEPVKAVPEKAAADSHSPSRASSHSATAMGVSQPRLPAGIEV